MIRVPLALRGIAVALLAASMAFGQTPEPPAELPADPRAPASSGLLRPDSAESRHPLLNWMMEGEPTSFDSLPSQESTRLAPKASASSPSTAAKPSDCCPVEIECPCAPTCLPFACPPQPPCYGHKCHRKHKHFCGGHGSEYNPYLGWPCAAGGCGGYASSCPYQGCGCRKCQRKHHHDGWNGPGYGGCGYPYGGYAGGCGMTGCDGFMDGGCCGGCSPFMAPPPPPQYLGCKFHHKHHCGRQDYGYPGCGSPYGGYGGCCGAMGCGGCMDGGCCGGCCNPFAPPPPPPLCHCRKCQRKHGGSSGYGYAGCGYPGWPAYPVPGAGMADGCYNGFTDPNCFGGCKHHHCHGLFHHCRGCHHAPPPYPYCAYPMMNCCMPQEELFCSDGCGSVTDFAPPSSCCSAK